MVASVRLAPPTDDPVSVAAVRLPPVWVIAPVVAVKVVVAPLTEPDRVRVPVLAVRLVEVPPATPVALKPVALVKPRPLAAEKFDRVPTALAPFSVALVPADPVRVAAVRLPPVCVIAPVVAVRVVEVPLTEPLKVRVPVLAVRLVEVPPATPVALKPVALVKLRPPAAEKFDKVPTALAPFSVALVPADPDSVVALRTAPPAWVIALVRSVSVSVWPALLIAPARIRAVESVRLTAPDVSL